MAISLNPTAINGFMNVISSQNNGSINSEELADGIKDFILNPLAHNIPELANNQDIRPLTGENLREYDIDENGVFDEREIEILLEAYFEFLATKITAPGDFRKWIENEFNREFSLPNPNQEQMVVDAEVAHLQPNPNAEAGEDFEDWMIQQVLEEIKVFDPLNPFGDEDNPTAAAFLEEQEDYNPFIIKYNNTFSGNAINWPESSSSGKEFVECTDDAPSGWMGNSYSRYVKPGGRIFIKMNINGSNLMVLKPQWWDTNSVPGTKVFNLIQVGSVLKFVSSVLASERLPEDFTALGADHCNQTSQQNVYQLEDLGIGELITHHTSPLGGRKRRNNITRRKKYKKLTKKSNKSLKKHNKKIIKKSKKNKKVYNKKKTNKANKN